ncbi:hypothetical protein Hanom_Chr06g00546791 [Helianthus anomalus]
MMTNLDDPGRLHLCIILQQSIQNPYSIKVIKSNKRENGNGKSLPLKYLQ